MATFPCKPYTNDTIKLFQNLNTGLYFCGLSDFWTENVNLPEKFVKIFNVLSFFIEVVIFSFMASEVVAFFTQNVSLLSKSLIGWRLVLHTRYCTFMLWTWFTYYKRNVRDVLYELAVVLKQWWGSWEANDQQTEVLPDGLCDELRALHRVLRSQFPYPVHQDR